jgi:hypothetical protein
MDDETRLRLDRMIYGTSFETSAGERIDPESVTPNFLTANIASTGTLTEDEFFDQVAKVAKYAPPYLHERR